ncbi:MAG: hypothetical protein PHT99_10000, partial [Methanoregula sp.]|nr:hypothetical protein [Methanoregula sp.]
LVNGGKIRYFYLSGSSQGGGGMNSGNSAIFSWVASSCTAIPSSEWGGTTGTVAGISGIPAVSGAGNRTLPGLQAGMSGLSSVSMGSATGNQNSLYDCAGYVDQAGT